MKILVIGSGGREHAIAWKLAQTAGAEVFAAPGNPGCDAVATCLAPAASKPEDYLALARHIGAALTVVGPEAPLAAGVVDCFRAAGLRIVGPTAAAARLEASKVFAKEIMAEAGIPTARAVAASSKTAARARLNDLGFPVVVKYDGLAAGKGVVICTNAAEAAAALDQLPEGAFVLEEFLIGEEVSFIAYIHENGTVVPFEATQDHKTIFDGDTGPNTGGMGAYCDGRIITASQSSDFVLTVIQPALNAMRLRGTPFSGFLYAGIMMTATGPKVLEFNARLGDPETQCLMHRMESDFAATLIEAAPMKWKPEPSVCVVAAAAGYPDAPRTGDKIHFGVAGSHPAATASRAVVFHAGTKRTGDHIVTAGGRVLGITASGTTLATAIHNTYAAVEQVQFEGMQIRRDIGAKGLKRW
jgi:phosphoribosylamine---glycine ligase